MGKALAPLRDEGVMIAASGVYESRLWLELTARAR